MIMMQYIDKNAVVAEIDRIKNTEYNGNTIGDDVACCALDMTIVAINTIEVKEVDLEKEIDIWYNKFATNNGFDWNGFAKHFFELGIYSQLSWQDIKRLAEIGDAFMNSEESDNLSEDEYYTEILNKFKAQKGK